MAHFHGASQRTMTVNQLSGRTLLLAHLHTSQLSEIFLIKRAFPAMTSQNVR